MIASRSRRGSPTLPSRQRSSRNNVAETSVNRRNVKPTGGRTPTADLTTMKLPAHRTMTPRTPNSARRRSAADAAAWCARDAADTETPVAVATGVDSVGPLEGASRLAISGAFAIELEDLLLVLLGQLQPDEQPGEHDERDDDERREGDAQRDRDCLECLHPCPPATCGWAGPAISRPAWRSPRSSRRGRGWGGSGARPTTPRCRSRCTPRRSAW